MTPDTIASLLNFGAAGLVIVVVWYFLRFIEKRDSEWQAFFTKIIQDRETPMAELAEAIHQLLSEFKTHDTWEHTKLDEMSKSQTRSIAKPRKPDA